MPAMRKSGGGAPASPSTTPPAAAPTDYNWEAAEPSIAPPAAAPPEYNYAAAEPHTVAPAPAPSELYGGADPDFPTHETASRQRFIQTWYPATGEPMSRRRFNPHPSPVLPSRAYAPTRAVREPDLDVSGSPATGTGRYGPRHGWQGSVERASWPDKDQVQTFVPATGSTYLRNIPEPVGHFTTPDDFWLWMEKRRRRRWLKGLFGGGEYGDTDDPYNVFD